MNELRILLEHLINILAVNIMITSLISRARTVLIEAKSASSAWSNGIAPIDRVRYAIGGRLGGRSRGAVRIALCSI